MKSRLESWDGSGQTAGNYHQIEQVPTVGSEALETEAVEADQEVEGVQQ